jgi:hypothetical protein
MKGILRFLLRFGLITALGILVTPYISRAIGRLADRAPRGSATEEFLVELRDNLPGPLVHTFGETVTDIFLR